MMVVSKGKPLCCAMRQRKQMPYHHHRCHCRPPCWQLHPFLMLGLMVSKRRDSKLLQCNTVGANFFHNCESMIRYNLPINSFTQLQVEWRIMHFMTPSFISTWAMLDFEASIYHEYSPFWQHYHYLALVPYMLGLLLQCGICVIGKVWEQSKRNKKPNIFESNLNRMMILKIHLPIKILLLILPFIYRALYLYCLAWTFNIRRRIAFVQLVSTINYWPTTMVSSVRTVHNRDMSPLIIVLCILAAPTPLSKASGLPVAKHKQPGWHETHAISFFFTISGCYFKSPFYWLIGLPWRSGLQDHSI